VYLTTKFAANKVALVAAVRNYKYTRDMSEIADEYSKLARVRRDNYKVVFAPREAFYVNTVASSPVAVPQYVSSDAVANEVSTFSTYERMRTTTPDFVLNQRDNASFGVASALADVMDYGRRRQEHRVDSLNEDRRNILYATAELAYGVGDATGQIARTGAGMYINAKNVMRTAEWNMLGEIQAGMEDADIRAKAEKRKREVRDTALKIEANLVDARHQGAVAPGYSDFLSGTLKYKSSERWYGSNFAGGRTE
jgi:hypothetical protein